MSIWKKGTLKDLVDLQRGYDLPSQNRVPGNIPVMGGGGLTGYHAESNVAGPGVIIGRSGAGFGTAFYCESDYWAHNTGLFVTNFKGNHTKYVYHFLNAFDFSKYNSGGAQPSLNRNFIYPIEIEIPPYSEQKSIAQLLDIWDEAIEKTERLIAAKEKQLRVLYQKCFQPGSSMNHAWKAKKISKYLRPRNEKSLPSEVTPLYSLTIEDGVTAKTDRYNRDFLVKDNNSKTYKVVYPGDIVFNPANLRWGAIARSEIKHKVVISPIYEVLEIRKELIDPGLLTHALTCSRQIEIYATKTEGTLIERMAVKLDSFLLTEILLPETIEEQRKIALLLDTANNEISLLKKQANIYRQQKRGLTQKLFIGQWRVKTKEENA